MLASVEAFPSKNMRLRSVGGVRTLELAMISLRPMVQREKVWAEGGRPSKIDGKLFKWIPAYRAQVVHELSRAPLVPARKGQHAHLAEPEMSN